MRKCLNSLSECYIIHRLAIMGLNFVNAHANICVMLHVHQYPSTIELSLRNMNFVNHHLAIIKHYKVDSPFPHYVLRIYEDVLF